MSRSPADRPAASSTAAGTSADRDTEPLRTMGWSELDQTTDWPLNFIVRPDKPGSGPPAGAELPVLTTLADASDEDDLPESHAPTESADSFMPTVFGPKLRHVDGVDPMHADPDGAPASIGQRRSAFANLGFLWLVLLLLLGIAAATWFWWPGLRQ